jgi:hypothetical protein
MADLPILSQRCPIPYNECAGWFMSKEKFSKSSQHVTKEDDKNFLVAPPLLLAE